MGHWPEHLFRRAEFSSIAFVLQRRRSVKQVVLSGGKRVRDAISLH
jgi:hypothetical protein